VLCWQSPLADTIAALQRAAAAHHLRASDALASPCASWTPQLQHRAQFRWPRRRKCSPWCAPVSRDTSCYTALSLQCCQSASKRGTRAVDPVVVPGSNSENVSPGLCCPRAGGVRRAHQPQGLLAYHPRQGASLLTDGRWWGCAEKETTQKAGSPQAPLMCFLPLCSCGSTAERARGVATVALAVTRTLVSCVCRCTT
jgi:hypothetical protein